MESTSAALCTQTRQRKDGLKLHYEPIAPDYTATAIEVESPDGYSTRWIVGNTAGENAVIAIIEAHDSMHAWQKFPEGMVM